MDEEIRQYGILPSWQEAAESNHRKRINWKDYLNMSLNQWVAERVADKRSQGSMEKELEGVALARGILNKEHISGERLLYLIHIGVGARIAEMRIEKLAFKARLSENCTWRAQVRGMRNGRGFLFIANGIDLQDGDMVEVRCVKLDAPNHDADKVKP